MYTSDTENMTAQTQCSGKEDAALLKAGRLRTGMRYLYASIALAAGAAVYGLFSHGVYSYYMTYAFMIPLLLGAVPHLAAVLRSAENKSGRWTAVSRAACRIEKVMNEKAFKDAQTAVIATLTAGSLLKGALDIYGTTNRLLIIYPVLAALAAAAGIYLTARRARAEAIPTSMPAAIPLNIRTGK